MFGINKRTVGIEISDQQVNAVEMISSPGKNRLVNFGIAKIDSSKGDDGVVEAVRNVLSTMKVKRRTKVNISIPSKEVDMLWINRPRLSEVEHSLHKQNSSLSSLSGNKVNEIVHDEYRVFQKKFSKRKSAIIRIEARRSVVDKCQELIESAGFTCGGVDVEPFSLLNCFINNGPAIDAKKTVALINVGAEMTNINIVRAGVLRHTKEIQILWRNLFDKLPEGFDFDCNLSVALRNLENGKEAYELWVRYSDLLVNFIVKTFLAFENEQARKVDDIFLYGKMVLCKNFQFHLQRILGLRVTVWNPAINVTIPKQNKDLQQFRHQAVSLSIPIGLASHQACSLNLLAKTNNGNPKKQRAQNRRKFFKRSAIGLMAVGIALFAFIWQNKSTNSDLNTRFIRQDYTGMTQAEVKSILGEPFFKEQFPSSGAYNQAWLFSLGNKTSATLEIRFKGDKVVNFLYQ